MSSFNTSSFISEFITRRNESYFSLDINQNATRLESALRNKRVLVIGGAGTIGSNYIKSILRFNPSQVVVVDTNENGLTELMRDIRSTPGLKVPKDFITYPVNLGDRVFEKIYEFYKPFDIIANFAAHKHVRSEKDVFSVEAMVQNNLFNAFRLLKLIEQDRPSHFFCVSTDKAANPVNIMGASKKLMEEIVMEYSSVLPCTTARFANVAFSNGSLLDGFTYRMIKRQPLSVPRDVKRYFVSPEESGDICMLSCMLGDTGDIYFPKLEPIQLTSFLEITESYLFTLGYKMDVCETEEEAKAKSKLLNAESKSYPVHVFSSDTTGEKLYEEFYTDSEVVDWTTYNALGVIKKPFNHFTSSIKTAIEDLQGVLAESGTCKQDVVDILIKHLPTFEHIEKGRTLDSRM